MSSTLPLQRGFKMLALSGLCFTLMGFAAGCSSQPTAPTLPPGAATAPPQGDGAGNGSGAPQAPQGAAAPGVKGP